MSGMVVTAPRIFICLGCTCSADVDALPADRGEDCSDTACRCHEDDDAA
jgi:hypothetical protein